MKIFSMTAVDGTIVDVHRVQVSDLGEIPHCNTHGHVEYASILEAGRGLGYELFDEFSVALLSANIAAFLSTVPSINGFVGYLAMDPVYSPEYEKPSILVIDGTREGGSKLMVSWRFVTHGCGHWKGWDTLLFVKTRISG